MRGWHRSHTLAENPHRGTNQCHNLCTSSKLACCPWSHGLRPKKLHASMAVLPAPVRVPSHKLLAPSVTSFTSVANDTGDNEMIPGAVHKSPGICLTAEEIPGKPQLGDSLMKGLCNQSSLQMGSLSSKACCVMLKISPLQETVWWKGCATSHRFKWGYFPP